jgi:hypothetical protein
MLLYEMAFLIKPSPAKNDGGSIFAGYVPTSTRTDQEHSNYY